MPKITIAGRKIGEIFSELKNKIDSGYTLRSILDKVDSLHFRTDQEKHEMSHLYESKIIKIRLTIIA